ncbi:hypothetical protein WAI453_003577 [Rhynchosporium graminicola]|uniref:Uncharacterized protein n=1 Tax=Rhynchosporium graminicola TaxID=2792576 RepID=A0A1E1LRS9_9HELO|nr:uncharacterized protein RCO7_01595 [Rhynchosporium commune]
MAHSIRRCKTDISERFASHSDESQDSPSTTPTSFHSSPSPSTRRTTDYDSKQPEYTLSPITTFCARSSTETYSSTVESLSELYSEPTTYSESLDYELPEYRDPVDHDIRPSNPSDFAAYFPTMNRLCIRHDDTTYDGNMNLRVDIERKSGTVQLFHLKMNDLKKREFSLRRYERGSGREVCHSARKFSSPEEKSPAVMARSVSNALASIVKPDFKRASSGTSAHSTAANKRNNTRKDSGYQSDSDSFDDAATYTSSSSQGSKTKSNTSIQIPTNTTKLEFSNYAQVQIKRRGAKSSKRYEFEYWGHKYTWKRVVKKDGEGKEISYHLYQSEIGGKGNGRAVAHIVPELMTRAQEAAEERMGGWVRPCSLWISDERVMGAVTDVADVIVATGLIALVDDSIKSRFHSQTSNSRTYTSSSNPSFNNSNDNPRPGMLPRTMTLPIPKFNMDMEFVSPRVLVEHMFKRRDSAGSENKGRGRPSPLRAETVVGY